MNLFQTPEWHFKISYYAWLQSTSPVSLPVLCLTWQPGWILDIPEACPRLFHLWAFNVTDVIRRLPLISPTFWPVGAVPVRKFAQMSFPPQGLLSLSLTSGFFYAFPSPFRVS